MVEPNDMWADGDIDNSSGGHRNGLLPKECLAH